MKYVIYILSALLIAAFIFMLVSVSFEWLGNGWYTDFTKLFSFAVMGTPFILAVIQLFKSTPRLVLLFGGAAALTSVELIAYGALLPGLCVFAAGMIPSVYEMVKHVRQAPPIINIKRGLLIGAGVLTCVYTILTVLNLISAIFVYQSASMDLTPVIALGIKGLVCSIGLAVVCFMKDKRLSEPLRMFLIGAPAMSVAFLPLDLAMLVSVNAPAVTLVYNTFVLILPIIAVLLVIIHTVKARKNNGAIPLEAVQIPAE